MKGIQLLILVKGVIDGRVFLCFLFNLQRGRIKTEYLIKNDRPVMRIMSASAFGIDFE
jgi:hypothetical protein